MALFQISKGLAANLVAKKEYAKEGNCYFTTDDGKFYIDIDGIGEKIPDNYKGPPDDPRVKAVIGINRIPLNAYASDVLKASTMPTSDDVVYPILAFKITDTAKNLVEAKYGSIGFKNGALVIPDNASKDEILIENKTNGNAIKIENTSESGYGIEITGSGKGIKVAQDPTENLELATKQYVDNKTELETINIKAGDNITIKENGNDLIISGTTEPYTHPTSTAHTAAAVKVGNDSLGHVVLGSALTKSDIGLGNVDNTSDANKPLSTAAKNEFKKYLPLAGGTMSGDIDMDQNALYNLSLISFPNPYDGSQFEIGIPMNVSNVGTDSFQSDYDPSNDFNLVFFNQSPGVVNGVEINLKAHQQCIQFCDLSGNENPITLRGIKDPVADSDVVNLKYLDTQLSTLLGANDAMLFKGTVASNADLPTTHEVGWTYRVNVAGTYAGQKCEVGDLVICIKDGITASNSDWTIGQTNTDVFAGATASVAGSTGLVPSPNAGSQTKFLKADGTWDDPSWNYLSDKPTQLNLQAGSNIDITEDSSNITIGVTDGVFASKTHNHDDSYVKKTGDTMSGILNQVVDGNPYYGLNDGTTQWYLQAIKSEGKIGLGPTWALATKWNTSGTMEVAGNVNIKNSSTYPGMLIYETGSTSNYTQLYYTTDKIVLYSSVNNTSLLRYVPSEKNLYFNGSSTAKVTSSGQIYGAVWNDYAEMREGDTIEAGRCVVEVGDDTLALSTKRMQPGANITSDTFGFAIGETDKCKTPIAVSGRVLAYGYESREEFKKNIGRPVCSGPNGTVSIMTDKEYKDKGYCAIGTISAVPDYEEWGTGKVKVDGRIWIKVF